MLKKLTVLLAAAVALLALAAPAFATPGQPDTVVIFDQWQNGGHVEDQPDGSSQWFIDKSKVKFVFHAEQGGSGGPTYKGADFQCRLDRDSGHQHPDGSYDDPADADVPEWTDCKSPESHKLTDGFYRYEVRATDSEGDWSHASGFGFYIEGGK